MASYAAVNLATIGFAIVMLAACGEQAAPPTATPAAPLPTSTLEPTSTPTPTATPIPTATPTPAPVAEEVYREQVIRARASWVESQIALTRSFLPGIATSAPDLDDPSVAGDILYHLGNYEHFYSILKTFEPPPAGYEAFHEQTVAALREALPIASDLERMVERGEASRIPDRYRDLTDVDLKIMQALDLFPEEPLAHETTPTAAP
jgi:hypothetical protein